MSTLTILLTAALLSTLSISTSAQCGNKCVFRFCQADGSGTVRKIAPRILLRAFDESLSSYICLPGGKTLGLIRETGQARVSRNGDARTPISKYSPRGLSDRFPKDYFRLYPIPFLGGLSGLGRRPTLGNQNNFLDDLCVVLPITKFDFLNSDGTVERTVTSSRRKNCVSFRTRNPELLIEVNWNSGDDLDLSLTEPDGDVISRSNPKSKFGKLNNDNSVAGCALVPAGKEAILYRKGNFVQPGTYGIELKHFNNCGNGPTTWTLRVVLDGITILSENGSSNLDKSEVITTASFTV